MSEDARFEDGREAPLHIGAMDVDDLKVVSALVQDAVFPASEMKYLKSKRQFALLLNRFRWEDSPSTARPPERVQSLLVISGVDAVASQGVARGDADTVMSLLSAEFEQTDAPAGFVTLTLAGDGAVRLQVEALEVLLKDVTRPYVAPSKRKPDHGA